MENFEFSFEQGLADAQEDILDNLRITHAQRRGDECFLCEEETPTVKDKHGTGFCSKCAFWQGLHEDYVSEA